MENAQGESCDPPARLDLMLFGSPLGERGDTIDPAVSHLNDALRAVIPVIERELGSSEAVKQAVVEWNDVAELPLNFAGTQAKRAALLFALWNEPDVQLHYSAHHPRLVKDLCSRVLPLVMPRFVANQAQHSDALVASVAVIATMWDAGDLGAIVPGNAPPQDK